MATSSSQLHSRTHNRHLYQMVPSKDDDAVRVTDVPDQSVDYESRHEEGGEGDRSWVSWTKQASSDLKLSWRRDT
jgi:hypothetical protein